MESKKSTGGIRQSATVVTAGSIASPVLAIRLFGAIEIRVQGAVVARLPTRRAMWLLAILAIRNGRPIERQSLASVIWPDSSQEGALHNLRQTLAGLRRSLGVAGILIESASPRSILLRPTPGVWLDMIEFDQASKEGTYEGLERAATLYRGPLLDGCDEPFAYDEREVRERSFVALAEALANHYITIQNYGAASDMLGRAIAIDPYRESAFRALMNLLAESGEAAAALGLYRDLRLSLRRDLHAEPDPETTDVYRSIRQKTDTNHGAKKTRLQHACLIPTALTALLGRDSEVMEVTSLLERCRLVTLIGVGGVGKTRLALAVAEATGDNYPDGVRFVDLAPVREPARIPDTIAASLRIPEQAGRSMLDTLVEKTRGLGLLIVIDNCEHLTQGVAATLEVLLSACPGLHILATSRQPIVVSGELIWRVPPLPTPGVQSPAPNVVGSRSDYLMRSESVRLFLNRSGDAGLFSSLSEAELEAIGSICRRLDGIPLAIELAAARTNVLSVIEIELRLQDRFDLLARTSRTTARHQSLNAAMEWSWDLLTEAERCMLMRLCVFRDGWTLEAAEAVSHGDKDSPSALDLMSSLVDRSMIVSIRGLDSIRYSMLETIRQFATERLREITVSESFYESHRDYFLKWAELARSKQFGPEETTWFKRLESEHDNLRAALDWSHARGHHQEGLRLAVALARFWDTHGHLAEGRARLDTSIDQVKLSAPPELLAEARVHAGWMATVQHDGIAAAEQYQLALLHFRTTGNRQGTATTLNCLSVAVSVMGDFHKAQELLLEALGIFQELGNRKAVATVLTNLAEMAISLDDNDAARTYLLQSMASVEDCNERNRESLGLTLCSLSLVDFRQNRYEEARANSIKALELFAAGAVFVSIPEALTQIAIADTAFREWERVAQLLGASEGLATSLGVPLSENAAGDRARAEAEALQELGTPGFRTAYDLGHKMAIEQAIEYALGSNV